MSYGGSGRPLPVLDVYCVRQFLTRIASVGNKQP